MFDEFSCGFIMIECWINRWFNIVFDEHMVIHCFSKLVPRQGHYGFMLYQTSIHEIYKATFTSLRPHQAHSSGKSLPGAPRCPPLARPPWCWLTSPESVFDGRKSSPISKGHIAINVIYIYIYLFIDIFFTNMIDAKLSLNHWDIIAIWYLWGHLVLKSNLYIIIMRYIIT